MPFKKCLSCGRRFISASGGFVKCVKCRGRECTKEKDCKAGDDIKKISTPAAAIDISYTKGSVDVGHFLSSDRRLYDQNMAQLEERNSSLKQSVDDNHHMKNIESTIKRNDFETIRSNDKLISYTKGNVGVDVGHFPSSDSRLNDQSITQLEERNSSLKQMVALEIPTNINHHMKDIESTLNRNDFETIQSNDHNDRPTMHLNEEVNVKDEETAIEKNDKSISPKTSQSKFVEEAEVKLGRYRKSSSIGKSLSAVHQMIDLTIGQHESFEKFNNNRIEVSNYSTSASKSLANQKDLDQNSIKRFESMNNRNQSNDDNMTGALDVKTCDGSDRVDQCLVCGMSFKHLKCMKSRYLRPRFVVDGRPYRK